MNTGQMLITIGAVVLLSIVILRISTTLLVTDNILNSSKVSLIAVSMATSIIEEANNKAFDNATFNNSVDNLSMLTPRSKLGPEAGEVYPGFDDFDDYNYFRITPKLDSIEIAENRSLKFEIFCAIDYVTASQPEIPTTSQQWHKRMTVKVTSNAMRDEITGIQDTIKMSTIFSYWYF